MAALVLGRNGLIGKELSKLPLPSGVYFFGSPSSNILFDEDISTCMRETIDGFINILDRCKRTGEYLVYPSSATVYNKNTSYARCKAILEELALAYDIPSLGVRIAAGYGPGEAHKGRYASVIYQWCGQMQRGERPIIFGDGTQTRDFIYQSDIAERIYQLARRHETGIVDIGTGINTSFNEVVRIINAALGSNIKPIYIDKPVNYVPETIVKAGPAQVDLIEGITRIINGC